MHTIDTKVWGICDPINGFTRIDSRAYFLSREKRIKDNNRLGKPKIASKWIYLNIYSYDAIAHYYLMYKTNKSHFNLDFNKVSTKLFL